MTDTDIVATIEHRPAKAMRNKPSRAEPTRKGTAAPNKSDAVMKLLSRRNGATVVEVSGATGWQAHSVRAFFSGLRKKGATLVREARKDGTSSHRLAVATLPEAEVPASVAASADATQVGA